MCEIDTPELPQRSRLHLLLLLGGAGASTACGVSTTPEESDRRRTEAVTRQMELDAERERRARRPVAPGSPETGGEGGGGGDGGGH